MKNKGKNREEKCTFQRHIRTGDITLADARKIYKTYENVSNANLLALLAIQTRKADKQTTYTSLITNEKLELPNVDKLEKQGQPTKQDALDFQQKNSDLLQAFINRQRKYITSQDPTTLINKGKSLGMTFNLNAKQAKNIAQPFNVTASLGGHSFRLNMVSVRDESDGIKNYFTKQSHEILKEVIIKVAKARKPKLNPLAAAIKKEI